MCSKTFTSQSQKNMSICCATLGIVIKHFINVNKMYIGLVLADQIYYAAVAAEQVQLVSAKCSEHTIKENMLLLKRRRLKI